MGIEKKILHEQGEKGEKTQREIQEHEREIAIEKNTLVLVAGAPGSGKSTFAMEQFPLDAIISTDRLRQELTNNPANQIIFGKAFFLAQQIMEERLKRGEIAVLDAQNLSEERRNTFYKIAARYGSKIDLIFLDTDVQEIVRRGKSRKRKIDEAVLKHGASNAAQSVKLLKQDSHLNSFHILKNEEARGVHVKLPPEYEKARAVDAAFLKEAQKAEAYIASAETGLIGNREKRTENMLPIEAGSVLFVENNTTEATRDFFSSNFLESQVVDAERIARRLGSDVSDAAVSDVMRIIIKERARHNLTSVVSYPKEFPFADAVRAAVKETADYYKVKIPMPVIFVGGETVENTLKSSEENPSFSVQIPEGELKNYFVEAMRDVPDDAPLFLVGDIQGCYRAMRELASRVRQENLGKDRSLPQRKIVFVGDMADRGPYDAESVIYISALVRSGRAMLIKGNHDENLLQYLRGEKEEGEKEVSRETRLTGEELKKRLKPESIQKIVEMLDKAPLYAEWQRLVVVHGALPRVPRRGQAVDAKNARLMTHGAKSGLFVGGRPGLHKLHETAAHDPAILVVGGHGHEGTPSLNKVSGTVNLDASVELKGELWGMYYPELEFASAKEPAVVRMSEILKSGELPGKEDLPLFIEWARQQSLIETKNGSGAFQGLQLITYSRVTELGNLWEDYPMLRHFRGLMVDGEGNIVARPFAKTHKAKEEVPLEKLNMVPQKVFEKTNGSLGIVYFWKDKWRVATKFSFENEGYTKPADAMLSQMNKDALDPSKTYLFEIILSDDSHIVDYGGKQELVLLNSVNTKTGEMDSWEEVQVTAGSLGARTAEDFTEKFEGMTIAQIYAYAQKEGNVTNLEGFMALYTDPGTGKDAMIKIKSREYSDRKFVRDHLNWEDIFEAVNPDTVDIAGSEKEKLLKYNTDNNFARAALEARIQWIRDEYARITLETKKLLSPQMAEVKMLYTNEIKAGASPQTARVNALRGVAKNIADLVRAQRAEGKGASQNAFMKFLGDVLDGKEDSGMAFAGYALTKIKGSIETEIKKRGKNSFWLTP